MSGCKPKTEQPPNKLEKGHVSALKKAGFCKRQSQIQNCKLSCKSTYDLVKIKNRSCKQSKVQQNWSQKKN